MKVSYLLIGLVAGGLFGFGLAKYLQPSTTEIISLDDNKTSASIKSDDSSWVWSDSLEALKTAPESHKTVFEDSSVRILQVLLDPGKTEPIHTHKWKSVMWFSHATPMTYFKYKANGTNYLIEDSFQIPQMPPAALNHASPVDAEGPHAIRNSGKEQGIAYRVEFKK